jgi:molybdopterin synthase sulfur carrier subunit
MPRVVFTPQLQRFVDAPEIHSSAATLRAALADAFAGRERLGAYVLDEQGHLRPNVVVFIDGRRCLDRVVLDDALAPDSTVHVMQALSGG